MQTRQPPTMERFTLETDLELRLSRHFELISVMVHTIINCNNFCICSPTTSPLNLQRLQPLQDDGSEPTSVPFCDKELRGCICCSRSVAPCKCCSCCSSCSCCSCCCCPPLKLLALFVLLLAIMLRMPHPHVHPLCMRILETLASAPTKGHI